MKETDDNGFVKLPDSEFKIMQIIWDMYKENKNVDAGSMMEAYPQVIGHLKLPTVLTLITRLNKKGFIASEKKRGINYYTPLVSEEQYKNEAAAEFIGSIYKNSPISLMSALFDIGAINQEDIEEFRKQILEKNNNEDEG
jgi:BlaI family penicillinase repressor